MAKASLRAMLARVMPQSESAATLTRSAANKRGLSLALDGTLREGAHDMRVFGLGFLRSVASLQDYTHFTTGAPQPRPRPRPDSASGTRTA